MPTFIWFENLRAGQYHVVSKLNSKGIVYTRLLDDITLSSVPVLNQADVSSYIISLANMFKKYNLKINSKKTKIEYKTDISKKIFQKEKYKKFEVTGLWLSTTPKMRKQERRYIRQLVYICEKNYNDNPFCEQYHDFWNKVSGKIAKMQRLNHIEAINLRKRIALIMPKYDFNMQAAIVQQVKKVTKISAHQSKRIGNIKKVNKIKHSIGILSRTNKSLAKSLRIQIDKNYKNMPSKKEFWEK